jgi:hypothetical protein
MRADLGGGWTPYCGGEAAAIASSRDGGAALSDSSTAARRVLAAPASRIDRIAAGRAARERLPRTELVIPDGQLIAPYLVQFAGQCGAVLARAHARTGDPIAIDSYIGKGRRFDKAMMEFARRYADQTELDHAQLTAGVSHIASP